MSLDPLIINESVAVVTGGGGGIGDPKTRDPEKVQADVRDGFVSVEGAMKDYGVNV